MEVLYVEVVTFSYSFNVCCSFSVNVLPVIVFVLVFVPVSDLVCGSVLQAMEVHSRRAVSCN